MGRALVLPHYVTANVVEQILFARMANALVVLAVDQHAKDIVVEKATLATSRLASARKCLPREMPVQK